MSTGVAAESLETIRFDGSAEEWDQVVSTAEHATFCHLAGWREILSDVLGQEPVYLGTRRDDGEWVGLLPLVRVRGPLFGDYLVSMPLLNYGGPIGAPGAQKALLVGAADRARSFGVDLLELRCREGMPGELPTSLRAVTRKITVLLPLPDSSEELWDDRFKSKLRSQIRRPMKEGMEARFGPGQLDAFYQVFARNMRDLGTPVLPFEFFQRIRDVLSEHVVFGAVYRGDEPVAAGCGFRWRDEFEMTWASSLREYNREAPNMLLYWSFMERCIDEGLAVFNFGRCTQDSGTHRFKRQWGGDDMDLPWVQWSSGDAEATPSPDGPRYRLATQVWSRLPLWFTNRVGPYLARRIP